MTRHEPTEPFHAMAAERVAAALETSGAGIAAEEAARRHRAHGPNRLPEPPRRSPVLRFVAHFHNVLIYVLLGATVITAALGHLVDTGVILAVIFANAVIGYIQEGRAEAAMAAIRGMLAPRSTVLRDGRRIGIDAAELVPGDVVLIEAGDRVPADLRLMDARGLKVEEAILTGESVPVDKSAEAVPANAARCFSAARWSPPAPDAGSWWRRAPRPRSGASAACSLRSRR